MSSGPFLFAATALSSLSCSWSLFLSAPWLCFIHFHTSFTYILLSLCTSICLRPKHLVLIQTESSQLHHTMLMLSAESTWRTCIDISTPGLSDPWTCQRTQWEYQVQGLPKVVSGLGFPWAPAKIQILLSRYVCTCVSWLIFGCFIGF